MEETTIQMKTNTGTDNNQQEGEEYDEQQKIDVGQGSDEGSDTSSDLSSFSYYN